MKKNPNSSGGNRDPRCVAHRESPERHCAIGERRRAPMAQWRAQSNLLNFFLNLSKMINVNTLTCSMKNRNLLNLIELAQLFSFCA